MEMMASWGMQAVVERLATLTQRVADGVAGLNVRVPDARFRAPHIISLGFAGDMPGGLIPALASEQIYVAPRLGRMRVSPHVYNDEADVDRFVAAMTRALG
jgi:selenocysteine lyase/cysteine desulfurase